MVDQCIGQKSVNIENCIHMLLACVCCDRIFVIENTELIVTHTGEEIIS